jgi:D-glycero-alpha-D-manno-heptose-7-phosphate kinase
VPHVERAAEATAPTRVDLAGGTLDIWPLYLFHPGAVTVNVAIDRRVWCRVEPLAEGVRIESKDTLVVAEAGSLDELLERASPPLAAFVLRALGIATGVRVTTRSRVPAGSGLGGSSALAVAVAAAAAAAVGRELPAEELAPLVRDAEAQSIGVPTGTQDHMAAIHGGLLAVHLEPGRPRVERLPVDVAAVEECLLLASSGETRFSGLNNWEVFKKQIDADAATRRGLGKIAAVARAVMQALTESRLGDVAGLLDAEWEARKRLAPGVTTPEIDRIAAIARDSGGAAKVCGAGGGGVVALWAAPGSRGAGPREALEAALKQAGIAVFPFRADLQGLEVEVE